MDKPIWREIEQSLNMKTLACTHRASRQGLSLCSSAICLSAVGPCYLLYSFLPCSFTSPLSVPAVPFTVLFSKDFSKKISHRKSDPNVSEKRGAFLRCLFRLWSITYENVQPCRFFRMIWSAQTWLNGKTCLFKISNVSHVTVRAFGDGRGGYWERWGTDASP